IFPFTDWATAATNIQAAIDASAAGDKVWVTNGLYDTGGRIIAGGALSNRVALTTALTVQSVNGPEATIIAGARTAVITNGTASMRCAWLTNGATLSGFTLTNGATLGVAIDLNRHGGGAYCRDASATLTNCIVSGNAAASTGGGVYQGTLCNCRILNNAAVQGGGAYNAWLSGCTASGNRASSGGGVYCSSNQVTISNCTLAENFASTSGGGAYQGSLQSCLLQSNRSPQGGGVYQSLLLNCIIKYNTANYGGGACASFLTNCALLCNRATNSGGGFSGAGRLQNCTVVDNQAVMGAGISGGSAVNSVIYFNWASGSVSNYNNAKLTNCCTSPVYGPPSANVIDADPLLSNDDFHLKAGSPCIGRGASAWATGVDLDGQAWNNPPAIGCDEWNPQPVVMSQPRVLPGDSPGQALVSVELAGLTSSCWWTKDGVPVEDSAHYSGAHTGALAVQGFNVGDAGVYQVVASNAFGVVTSALVTVTVACVDVASSSPALPYDDWSRAARTIQEAVDAAQPGAVVLVTNGLYNSGGRYVAGDMTNRVVLDKSITLLSMNGPEQTIIEGAWDPATTTGPASVRCAWVAEGAVLGGFTLRGGSTPLNGGGVWSSGLGLAETTVGCVITNCRAGVNGGGAYQGRLRACSIQGNVAAGSGGGTASAFADHCTLALNSAGIGGGAFQGITTGCVVTGNTGSQGAGVSGGQVRSSLIATNNGEGVRSAYVVNSRLVKNTDSGAGWSTVQGSLIMGNTPYGAWRSICLNCNFVGNDTSAYSNQGSTNCISWFNANPSSSGSKLACLLQPDERLSAPLTSNRWLLPNLLSDGIHLASDSPGIGRGVGIMMSPADIDGQAWGNPPSIGCDEWNPQPLIVSQPRVLPAAAPGQALVSIELAGLTTSCWWTKDGVPVEDGAHYSSAHTSALAVQGFNIGDAGVYQVVASNAFGVVTSALVTVTVACVDAASLGPVAPYDAWSRAAPTIQEAVDAAQPGAVVLVTNGLYNSGGRFVAGDMTNRVVLDKSITLLSMNGPEQTIIEGAWDPATTNGPASVRCAWVAEGAVLGGFTLRGGSTPLNGGGIWSPGLGLVETTVGCVVTNCRAGGDGGGAYQGRLRDCIITGNSAGANGGGTARAVVDKCLLQANSASSGGGLYGGAARQCRILANTASGFGSIGFGGGASGQSSLLGCAIAFNQAKDSGGAWSPLLYHSTVVSNLSLGGFNGGINFCGAWNSMIYFNVAPSNNGGLYENTGGSLMILQNSCYRPFHVGYPTCITNNPQLLDVWHVATTSPCRGTGTNLLQVGFADIDNQNWNSPPSMGCDEVNDAALTGPLSLSVAAWPEVAVGGVMPLTATITGQASRLEWSFGDGTVVADVGFSTTHQWTNAGSYTVTATVFNWDNPSGVAVTLPVEVVPLASPVLTAPRLSQQTFSMQFTGQPGLTYDFQQATSLTAPVAWQTLQTVNSAGGVITVTDPQATGPTRFYRVQSR
ncbi:MAG: PKD domain-containing protein, partial [Verrucomicrobia bacterium]|nr:PKD domain-containing protein [Verrucomicrobiota bacterium]